ncbi:MAG: hypothetical protein R3F59_11305 [Myxococcota bacterium]
MKSEFELNANLFDWFHARVKSAHQAVGVADLSPDGSTASLLAERAFAPIGPRCPRARWPSCSRVSRQREPVRDGAHRLHR